MPLTYQPQRKLTPEQLNTAIGGLFPSPMGVIESKGGAGIMDLIKQMTQGGGFKGHEVVGDITDWGQDFIKEYSKNYGGILDPGMNTIPTGNRNMFGQILHLIYADSKGEPVAMAEIHPTASGMATKAIATDKSKGLLGGKAAMTLGKKILEMGAALPVEGDFISQDTYKLLQHLAKVVK